MNTSRSSAPATSLRVVLVLTMAAFTAGQTHAENPFKVLRSKAKQGLSKVARVVDPRRIGAAIRTEVAAPPTRVPLRQVNPPVRYYDGTTVPDTTTYYPETPLYPRPYSTQTTRRTVTSVGSDRFYPAAETGTIYTPAPLIREIPIVPTHPAGGTGVSDQIRRTNPAPSPASTAPSQSPAPPTSVADAPSTLADPIPTDASTSQTSSSPTKASAAPAATREDLPFGEPVPGKSGFVYTPYSTKELVDVSGIPTGTKVKCPYSGKTFRVP